MVLQVKGRYTLHHDNEGANEYQDKKGNVKEFPQRRIRTVNDAAQLSFPLGFLGNITELPFQVRMFLHREVVENYH